MKPSRIMIIDDESITRMDLKEILEEEGYQIAGVGKNGDEAVELAYRLKPDLIIMDVKMPKLNGIKAASIIKGFCDCAVILLTAYSHREFLEEAKKAGIQAYLVKPIKEKDLLPAIEIALSQRQQILSLQEKIYDLERKMTERKMIEKAKGIIMKRLNCTEEQAYRWMQKTSMETHDPMISLAQKVIQPVTSS